MHRRKTGKISAVTRERLPFLYNFLTAKYLSFFPAICPAIFAGRACMRVRRWVMRACCAVASLASVVSLVRGVSVRAGLWIEPATQRHAGCYARAETMQKHEGPSDQPPCAARETALMPFARIYALIRRALIFGLAQVSLPGDPLMLHRDDIAVWNS